MKYLNHESLGFLWKIEAVKNWSDGKIEGNGAESVEESDEVEERLERLQLDYVVYTEFGS